MLNRRTFLATATLSALGLPTLLRRPALAESINGPENRGIVICAVGNLRRIIPSEMVLLSARSSNAEQTEVIRQIVREKPELLLLLGDQVADGNNLEEWGYYDAITKPFTEAKIPTFAVLGDRDHGEKPGNSGRRESTARWPETTTNPHFTIVGGIAFIGIESNLSLLTASEAHSSQKSFVDALERFDSDPAIRGVIVTAHHAPYTNSALGPNSTMITQYVEPFLAARKTRLFLTGDVASYERFTIGSGKHFVTSGGGGAPRRAVDVSAERPFTDRIGSRLPTIRPYNFLKLTIIEERIVVEGMMLQTQKRKFVVGDRFRIDLAEKEPASTE